MKIYAHIWLICVNCMSYKKYTRIGTLYIYVHICNSYIAYMTLICYIHSKCMCMMYVSHNKAYTKLISNIHVAYMRLQLVIDLTYITTYM